MNIKSHKKTMFHPLFRRHIFGKLTPPPKKTVLGFILMKDRQMRKYE